MIIHTRLTSISPNIDTACNNYLAAQKGLILLPMISSIATIAMIAKILPPTIPRISTLPTPPTIPDQK